MCIDILFAAELHADRASARELLARIATLRALRPCLNDKDHEHAGVLIKKLSRLLEAQAEAA
jgi:hypothetical protein